MTLLRRAVLMLVFATLAACGGGSEAPAEASSEAPVAESAGGDGWNPVVPGLQMRITTPGDGAVAAAGQMAMVHYTGWLHDPEAPDGRGDKFDSSVDRGQHFEFPLGAGRVIRGWDQGVEGMHIGETRELLIAPEMGYGDRGAGSVIPPGATLLFEVQLAGLDGSMPAK